MAYKYVGDDVRHRRYKGLRGRVRPARGYNDPESPNYLKMVFMPSHRLMKAITVPSWDVVNENDIPFPPRELKRKEVEA